MKLRTLLILALGVGLGYKLAKSFSRDDASIVKGPREQQRPANPVLRTINGRTQRLADQATTKSLDVIRGARRMIQTRLRDPDATWN